MEAGLRSPLLPSEGCEGHSVLSAGSGECREAVVHQVCIPLKGGKKGSECVNL